MLVLSRECDTTVWVGPNVKIKITVDPEAAGEAVDRSARRDPGVARRDH